MTIANDKELTEYIEMYVNTLVEEIGKLRKDEQTLFEFQNEQPLRCVGFISETHGAAVAFFPSERKTVEIRRISGDIESIFPKDPRTGDTLIQTRLGPDIEFDKVWKLSANLQLRDAVFLQAKRELAILEKGLSLTVDEKSVLLIEDKLILKGSNGTEAWSPNRAVKDAMWNIFRVVSRKKESDIRQIGARVEEYKKKYDRVKTEIGILVEYAIRDLCRRFDGQQIDGSIFGTPNRIKLPKKPRVEALDDPQIDALLSDDEKWVIEVKKRNREATVRDLEKLQKKARLVQADKIWFISESGFRPNATSYAIKNRIMISSKDDTRRLARIFNMQF